MRSWFQKFVLVSSALAISAAFVSPSLARPGDADTQMQVEIDQYTAKIKANPRDFDSIYLRGQLFRKLGKLDLCEADGNALVVLNPKSPHGFWLLSRVAKDKGDRESGLKYIRACISREKLVPDHVHYELVCLRGLKRYNEMYSRANDLEKVLPKDPEIFYLRAFARSGLNQSKELVRADLEKAKALSASNSSLIPDIDKALLNVD